MLRKVIKGFTSIFKPPVAWDEETNGPCSDLHVRESLIPEGGMVCESAYEPTPRELEILNAGGCVVLRIWGGQPPVALYVEPQ